MLADLNLPPIVQTPAKETDFAYGRSEPVRAFVNHRMVGTLPGTDRTFQAGDANRAVSTTFGIGYSSTGKLEIHQYVALDDTAYGNGNYDPTGNWDNWGFKTTEINAQTINIEHQDNGGRTLGTGKGIVPEEVQQTAMKLWALLRYGTIEQWKAAGIHIRDWASNAPILKREIGAIPMDNHHVITHNDISGKLKPYCWKPWADDKEGFNPSKYLDGIQRYHQELVKVPAPPPPPPTYTQAQLDAAVAKAVADATAAASAKIASLTADLQTTQLNLNKAITAVDAIKLKVKQFAETI